MGVIKNGIMGPVTNKVGTVIGRNFRGLNVITQLYKKSKKSATNKQERAQIRLGLLSKFLSGAQKVVDPGFIKTIKAGQSPLNAAYSYNYRHAFVEENDETKLNFPKLVLSRGPIERPNCAAVKREGNKIVFSWLVQAENKYSRHDDRADFLMYAPANKKMILLKYKAMRSALQFEFKLPKSLQEYTFHCFMIFSNQNGKLVGTSEYVGITQLSPIS